MRTVNIARRAACFTPIPFVLPAVFKFPLRWSGVEVSHRVARLSAAMLA